MRSRIRTSMWVALTLTPAWLLPAADLPNAPGRDTVKKVCSACHPAEVVLGHGMNREQWGNMVSNMISRGAKGTDEEFSTIVDYLAKNLPPKSDAPPSPSTSAAKKRPNGGGLLAQAGAADKQVVDEEAATRGQKVYVAACITCHGTKARGTSLGPDLVRSVVVLKDRYGNALGPYLANGHPSQGGATASSSLTAAQVEDLSHFLKQKVDDTLRTGPYNKVLNVLTGDPKAGEAYFNGAGRCTTCHSVTGDLAHIASRYDPPTLQLKMVFPQTVAFGKRSSVKTAKKQTTVTVTSQGGESVTGVLQEIDDFSVSLIDPEGQYKTFERSEGVKVEVHDPYEAHEKLLDQYTDGDIHNLVAYLNTLK
jgi:mono/diheme cytochrome c family protein